MLKYPAGFPPHLQAPVEGALARAELKLRQGLSMVPSIFEMPENSVPWITALKQRGTAAQSFVDDVFQAFFPLAFQAGREGSWTPQRIREAVEHFATALIPDAATLAGLSGWHSFGSFCKFMLVRLQDSEAWTNYLHGLAGVADEIASAPAVTAPRTSRKTSRSRVTKDSEATQEWRREALDGYATRHAIDPESRFLVKKLARHLKISRDTLYSLVRGDGKYAAEKKDQFLAQIGVSAADWDKPR
jgi:hypothetical protein